MNIFVEFHRSFLHRRQYFEIAISLFSLWPESNQGCGFGERGRRRRSVKLLAVLADNGGHRPSPDAHLAGPASKGAFGGNAFHHIFLGHQAPEWASSLMVTGAAVRRAFVKTLLRRLDQTLGRRWVKPRTVVRLVISGRELRRDAGRAWAIHSLRHTGCGGVSSWARATRQKPSKSSICY